MLPSSIFNNATFGPPVSRPMLSMHRGHINLVDLGFQIHMDFLLVNRCQRAVFAEQKRQLTLFGNGDKPRSSRPNTQLLFYGRKGICMSFRVSVALLCLSTVVIAQVPLSAPPSPSLPEVVDVEQLPPSISEKPIAPRQTKKKSRRSGLRLAASLSSSAPEIENPSRQAIATSDDSDALTEPAEEFPRTASLGTHGLVPIPRPLPQTFKSLDDTRFDRLTRELVQKQKLLDEIQAEILQLSLDIAAAEPDQVFVAMVIYELATDQIEPIAELLSPGLIGSGATSNAMLVMPSESERTLKSLADAGFLRVLSQPQIVTMSGREAGIEIGHSGFSFAATITPHFENSEWNLETVWKIKNHDTNNKPVASPGDYARNARFRDGKVAAFRIINGTQVFVAVLHPQVVSPEQTVKPVSYSPLLPIPEFDDCEPIQIIRNVDINLKKTSAIWRKVY